MVFYKKKVNRRRILIGRKDIADFPELGLNEIEVKVDSGAYTSSFHCASINKHMEGEKEVIRCIFLDPDHPQYHEKEFCFDQFNIRKVKSSNGIVEERFSIFTKVVIFNETYTIELTLTERADMKHPVLLGRKFTSKKFLIDTSRKNLSFNKKIIQIEI